MKTLFSVLHITLLAILPSFAQDTIFPAEDLDAIKAQSGNRITVEGTILSMKVGSNKAVYFDIGLSRGEGGLTVVVVPERLEVFPDGFDMYVDKKVRVLGKINTKEEDRTRIFINEPADIEIIP